MTEADDPAVRWARPLAVAFVLLGIPYLNLRKNVADWTRVRAVPEVMYGIPAWLWFELAVLVVAVGTCRADRAAHAHGLWRSCRRALLGQGQGLYLVLLAIMVIGNFERAVVSFAAQRLVTEGVIHCTALLCAVTLLISDSPAASLAEAETVVDPEACGLGRLVAVGVTAALHR